MTSGVGIPPWIEVDEESVREAWSLPDELPLELAHKLQYGYADTETLERVLLWYGRNSGPWLLNGWWCEGLIDVDQLRALICEAWEMAEFPSQLGQRAWLSMFKATGFVSDNGQPAPVEPLTVYRGALMFKRRGFSWTVDREQARWFAERFSARTWPLVTDAPARAVFAATVPPHAVLAVIHSPEGRKENEVVVNPNCLRGSAAPRLIEVVSDGAS